MVAAFRPAHPWMPARFWMASLLLMGGAAGLAWSSAAHAQSASGKKAAVIKPAAKKVPAAVVAAAPVLAAQPLNADELAVASQVYVGMLACELGKSVRMEADEKTPGYFHLHLDQYRFQLRPVQSRTGAVRLEDIQQGAVWIQLANKSMLMSQKLGRRLVDGCAGEAQQLVAAQLERNPAPSLLDPLPRPAAPVVAVSTPVPTLNLDTPTPVPAMVAADCRRPVGGSSLPSGDKTC